MAKSDNSPRPLSRPYRKGKRAEAEAETRQRITEAAVELHGTVGPAKSTVTDVAKLAGVSRMTVYNHFPTEVELFVACSTHWATQNPFPDPSEWAVISDHGDRLVHALSELYGWYGHNQAMLGNVLRDVAVVPSLAEVMNALWSAFMDGAVEALAHAWPVGDAEAEMLHAALRLAVDFGTWQCLIDSGLDGEGAVGVMARMVTGAVGST